MSDLLDRLKSALSDRYAIERELGAGGMATVYLAEDIKHHRPVAVKVLRPELAAVVGAERFLREIEVTANLHHPHILPLYDSGEADGFLYYVMPFVEGESLRDRLNREKQLPVEDAVKIASEVADALNSAHRHDVIHRDIKPENILLEEGHAVVADFGIARAIHAAGGEKLTETGVSIGTPQYMSPEQAAGTSDLDGRSDVYSLGCVLYEMLGGQPPFTGPTVESIIHQHITVEAPPITNLRPAVPAEIAGTIARALAKAPADRFSAAGQLATALDRRVVTQTASVAATISDPTGSKRGFPTRLLAVTVVAVILFGVVFGAWRLILSPRSASKEGLPVLAVLPPENFGSAEDATLGDGLVLELQSKLTSLSGLKVIGSTSTRPYKDTDKTARQIGEELGADYIMRLSIQWQRNPGGATRVRVVPQLIDASDNTQLWSESYDEALTDVFQLQSNVAGHVIEAIGVVLLEPEQRLFAERPTQNADAWESYLKGSALLNRALTPYIGDASVAAHGAVQAFEKAVQSDASFGLAYARLAMAHYGVAFWGDDSVARFAMIKDAAEEALRLAPELPQAKMALGMYYYQLGQGDLESALREMEPALQRQPNNAFFLQRIANVQRRQGDLRQAAANYTLSADLDPLDFNHAREGALTYLRLRDYEQAERFFDRSDAIRPTPITYARRALLFLMRDGDVDSAVEAMSQMRTDGLDLWQFVVSSVGHVLPRRIALRVFCIREGCQEAVSRFGDGNYRGKADLYGLLENPELERSYSDSAVVEMQNLVRDRPWDLRAKAQLCLAYAGAGQPELLRREGERLQALEPHLKDALWGPDILEVLAEAYVRIGDHDEAIDQLEVVLSVPSVMTTKLLEVDPVWDPLRDNPRFQALLAKYEN